MRDLVPAIGAPHPSVTRLRQSCWPHLLTYLQERELDSDELTLVYGDTHDGGSGEPQTTSHRVRLYNTGGWVVHNQLEHPPTQRFAVDTDGNEYILDVGFQGVRLSAGDEKTEIIALAAEDAEHRATTISQVRRRVLATLPMRQ